MRRGGLPPDYCCLVLLLCVYFDTYIPQRTEVLGGNVVLRVGLCAACCMFEIDSEKTLTQNGNIVEHVD